jgi:itaconyl-CoA hydratase
MTNPSDLTGNDNYFEDFVPGAVMRHARGKTIETSEHVMVTNLAMNSAQGHFNEEAARATPFGQRMTFGGYTAALVIGLSSQDTSENALAELTLNKIRFGTPVFAGDTIIAFTEVLAVSDGDDPAAGIVHFKHWGVNQDDKVVFEGERKVLVKRRGARP